MKDLLIIGAGNVGGFLALNQEMFQEPYRVIGFLDDDPTKIGKEFWSIPVLGSLSALDKYDNIAIAIGISNPLIKKKVLDRMGSNCNFPSFISKKGT